MTQKKSSNWYIAATHYLTAAFVIPLVVGLVASFLVRVGASFFLVAPLLATVFLLVMRVLAVWLGTKYSASYLKKTYIIENKNKIINLAVIYFFVLSLVYIFTQVIVSVGFIGRISGVNVIYYLIEMILVGFLFYFFSKKYIKNTNN